jgi:hypothetical protein
MFGEMTITAFVEAFAIAELLDDIRVYVRADFFDLR